MPEIVERTHHSKNRTNGRWLQELQDPGPDQDEALQELSELLLRASLYTFHRYQGEVGDRDQEQILQWAEDCAQDALIAVLKHLADFRGESKFTTWAYKFAVNTVLMSIRHEKWKGVSLDELEPETMKSSLPVDSMDFILLRGEIGQVLQATLQEDLTEKQRKVLKWIVFEEIPMDVVVERLDTNRNAVYQLLHDARKKMKQKLAEKGFNVEEALDFFGAR